VKALRARLDAWKKEVHAIDASPHAPTTRPLNAKVEDSDANEK